MHELDVETAAELRPFQRPLRERKSGALRTSADGNAATRAEGDARPSAATIPYQALLADVRKCLENASGDSDDPRRHRPSEVRGRVYFGASYGQVLP